MAKAKAILPLIELISKEKSLYIDILDRRDLADINKAVKILSRNEDTKMPNIKHIPSESKHIIPSRSRSGIESI